ncbi:flagellar hook-associated protein FlgK [Bacillus sp. 2205SS5-2]|uniref:flagellar hook-associated protein FlgK n=1 Tax=Bacillus sp. 2205SS5-2 TaxID=3109031 RepID=UPI003007DA3E
MVSTFHGLETAIRGMYTQQSALYTTGHNISNANTPGYTRQRVNFEQTSPYPAPSMNRPQIPGQVGTGVEAGSIERVREQFLDVQFRGENNKLGYWETKMESLKKMEEVMNEPSESGLAKTMDQLWQSLQDLAVNPTNDGARSVVRQRAVAVAETFNYISSSLSGVQKDIQNELSVTEKNVNALLNQLHQLNNQISDVEPHGLMPNDLYDERDRLIDDLSQLVDVKVSYQANGGNASPLAEGRAIVYLASGETNLRSAMLVGKDGANSIKVNYDSTTSVVNEIEVGNQKMPIASFESIGKLKGLIESYGYVDQNGDIQGSYANMLAELDNLAFTFTEAFNAQHQAGVSPAQMMDNTVPSYDFFKDQNNTDLDATNKAGFASRMEVSAGILQNLDHIASASTANPTMGNAENITALANVIDKLPLNYGANPTTFKSHYESMIGDMAVQSQEAVRLSSNSEVLRSAVDTRRQSVSSVSLDEEMTNMIKFQHAYNASARIITLTDEMLDKIINGMGTGGR